MYVHSYVVSNYNSLQFIGIINKTLTILARYIIDFVVQIK